MTDKLSSNDDVIDGRDVIERIEELRALRDEAETEASDGHAGWMFGEEEREELDALEALAAEVESYISDWGALIRETYFTEYVEELLKDAGDVPQDIPVYLVIDWEATADNIRVDYTEVEFDGVTYLVR